MRKSLAIPALICALCPVVAADWVVMKDGTEYEVLQYSVQGPLVLMTGKDGRRYSARLDYVDLEASRIQTEESHGIGSDFAPQGEVTIEEIEPEPSSGPMDLSEQPVTSGASSAPQTPVPAPAPEPEPEPQIEAQTWAPPPEPKANHLDTLPEPAPAFNQAPEPETEPQAPSYQPPVQETREPEPVIAQPEPALAPEAEPQESYPPAVEELRPSPSAAPMQQAETTESPEAVEPARELEAPESAPQAPAFAESEITEPASEPLVPREAAEDQLSEPAEAPSEVYAEAPSSPEEETTADLGLTERQPAGLPEAPPGVESEPPQPVVPPVPALPAAAPEAAAAPEPGTEDFDLYANEYKGSKYFVMSRIIDEPIAGSSALQRTHAAFLRRVPETLSDAQLFQYLPASYAGFKINVEYRLADDSTIEIGTFILQGEDVQRFRDNILSAEELLHKATVFSDGVMVQ
jgi:hypothetical protein